MNMKYIVPVLLIFFGAFLALYFSPIAVILTLSFVENEYIALVCGYLGLFIVCPIGAWYIYKSGAKVSLIVKDESTLLKKYLLFILYMLIFFSTFSYANAAHVGEFGVGNTIYWAILVIINLFEVILSHKKLDEMQVFIYIYEIQVLLSFAMFFIGYIVSYRRMRYTHSK